MRLNRGTQIRDIFGGQYEMSLRSQLKTLQEKDRIVRGIQSGSKERPSFIFSEKQAADYDNETIHALSKDAFDILCTKDRKLTIFGERFYSKKTIFQDISLFTNEIIEKEIRSEISGLLQRLCLGHFLDPDAHKALEWLVRRWRVNELFIDELILAIIPFHETLFFVRMVQIVYFTQGSRWSFLYDRVKRFGNTITRINLATQAIKDNTIFNLLDDMTKNVLSQNDAADEFSSAIISRLVSFYSFMNLEALIQIPKLADHDAIAYYQRSFRLGSYVENTDAAIASLSLVLAIAEKAPISTNALLTSLKMPLAKNPANPDVQRAVLLTLARFIESGLLGKSPEAIEDIISKIDSEIIADARSNFSIDNLFTVAK